jgi:hypothetical protein
MKTIRVLAAGIVAVMACSGVAFAGSHPQDHHGFFIGFNLGAGTAQIKNDSGSSEHEWGGAGNLRLGGAVKNNLLLGAEFTGWTKDQDGSTVSLSSVLFAVTYYPTTEGFFLRGGMGFGSSDFSIDLGNGVTQSKSETGFALALATGYEWRLTQKFALGPQVEFNWMDIGGDLVDTANFFDATLGFNWYW